MAAHSITFFLDGFETSSIFIAFTLFELSQNPDIQAKLREEIKETKAKKGGLTYETIADMEYLDQVCNESLRMHPPGAFMAKKCTEDIELNFSKTQTKTVLIEKGTTVIIPLLSLHRDPQNFSCPDTFNPDRFSAENGGAKFYKDKGIFFPFGDGPRICLGMRFALAQSKAAIVEVVEKFELLKSSKVQLPLIFSPSELLNVPIGGVWAKFKPILAEWSG
jgi:cytochrome P450